MLEFLGSVLIPLGLITVCKLESQQCPFLVVVVEQCWGSSSFSDNSILSVLRFTFSIEKGLALDAYGTHRFAARETADSSLDRETAERFPIGSCADLHPQILAALPDLTSAQEPAQAPALAAVGPVRLWELEMEPLSPFRFLAPHARFGICFAPLFISISHCLAVPWLKLATSTSSRLRRALAIMDSAQDGGS